MSNQSSVANISVPSSATDVETVSTLNTTAATTPDLERSDYYDAPPAYPWNEVSVMPIGDNNRTEYYVWGMDIDYSYPKHAKFKRFKRKVELALAKGDRQLLEPSSARGKLARLFKRDNSSVGVKTLSKLSNKSPAAPAATAVQTRMSVYEFLRLDEDDGTVVECVEEVDDEDEKKEDEPLQKWCFKLLNRERKQNNRWKRTRDQSQKMHIVEEKEEKSRMLFW
ncbi:hypothetical protein V1506DRAFT_554037 [Lipomyces tetrasporus]